MSPTHLQSTSTHFKLRDFNIWMNSHEQSILLENISSTQLLSKDRKLCSWTDTMLFLERSNLRRPWNENKLFGAFQILFLMNKVLITSISVIASLVLLLTKYLHPCLTDPSKVLILLGVSSQVLGGERETKMCLGWRQLCLGFAWGGAFFTWGGV